MKRQVPPQLVYSDIFEEVIKKTARTGPDLIEAGLKLFEAIFEEGEDMRQTDRNKIIAEYKEAAMSELEACIQSYYDYQKIIFLQVPAEECKKISKIHNEKLVAMLDSLAGLTL